jgi:AcrR family transcriptional regulator
MSASRSSDSPAPAGRDAVIAAVLAATERLCASGQPSSFTVRQIAAEAGVTTSLLYFYFKSKDDIVLATVRSLSAEIDAAVAGEGDVGALSTATSRMIADHPAFPRLLAWLVLEGRSFAELADDPFLGRLARMFTERGHSDPRTASAAVVTMLLGNALFRDAVNVAIERTPDDERLIQALDQARVAFADEAVGGSPTKDSATD